MKVYIRNDDRFFDQTDYVQQIAQILRLGQSFWFESTRHGDKTMVFEIEDISLKDLQAIANLTADAPKCGGLIIRESEKGSDEVYLHIYDDYIE